MRTITLIIIHCSAVRPDQQSSAAQIDSWHRKRGFKFGIGYHYVIRRDGTIEPGRPEWMIGAHCHVAGQNHNKYSIGVCYEGGLDIRGQPADTRTEAQKQTMRRLLEKLHERYPPRRDSRSPRPEPPQGLSVHQGCSKGIQRSTAEVKYRLFKQKLRLSDGATSIYYGEVNGVGDYSPFSI